MHAAAGSGGNCSVYYLVNARGGVSAFLVTNTILVVLPFALSYWEDVQKNYINCILPRVHSSVYSFSHVLMTAFDGFLAVFLGYSLCFGLMALSYPINDIVSVNALTSSDVMSGSRSAISPKQSELAQQAGVSVRTIQQYEQRRKDINKAQTETLLKIARALVCTVEDLVEKVPT